MPETRPLKSCSLLSDSGKNGLRARKNGGRVQKCRLGRQRANKEGYQLRGLSAARSSSRSPSLISASAPQGLVLPCLHALLPLWPFDKSFAF
jgi:hypothetical protein